MKTQAELLELAREVVELLLRENGAWTRVLERYEAQP